MKISRKVLYQIIFILCCISCMIFTIGMTIDMNSRLNKLSDEYKTFVNNTKATSSVQVERIEQMSTLITSTTENLERVLKNNESIQQMLINNEIFNDVYKKDEVVEIKKKEMVTKVERKPTYKKLGEMTVPMDIYESAKKYSTKKKVDKKMLLALMYKESSFNPKAKNKIHYGLGQISERTGRYIHEGILKRTTPYKPEMLYDVNINVEYTTAYLAYLFNLYKGDRYKVLKHYSGSKTPSVADKYVGDIDRLIKKL